MSNLFSKSQEYERAIERLKVLENGYVSESDVSDIILNRIILVPVVGDVVVYPKTSAGMDAASAAAVSGDTIWFPVTGSIPDDHTLTAGVVYASFGRGSFQLTGTITGTADSVLENMWIYRAVNTAGTEIGYISPGAGSAYLKNSAVQVIQAGAGNAYGVQSVGGVTEFWFCHVTGEANGGGSGYAGFLPPGPAPSGDLYFFGGRVYGTTDAFNRD